MTLETLHANRLALLDFWCDTRTDNLVATGPILTSKNHLVLYITDATTNARTHDLRIDAAGVISIDVRARA